MHIKFIGTHWDLWLIISNLMCALTACILYYNNVQFIKYDDCYKTVDANKILFFTSALIIILILNKIKIKLIAYFFLAFLTFQVQWS